MKYEEIVKKVKTAYAKADTALVDEHLAVQVDVTGEGEGAFYIEVADGKINVEPWEYLDHDFKIRCTAEEIIAIASGKKKLGEEVEAGNVYVSRNVDKVAVFDLIVAKKSSSAKKKAETEVKAEEAEKPAARKSVKRSKKAADAEPKTEAVDTETVAVVAPETKKRGGRKPKAVAEPKAEAAEKAAPETKKRGGRKPKAVTEAKA